MDNRTSTINSILFTKIGPYLERYDCSETEIGNFLIGHLDSENRQTIAVKIINEILKFHDKQNLSIFIDMLSKIEPGIKEAQTYIRDHIKHSLLCFILGIYVNETILRNFHEGNKVNIYVNTFQWKIASLLHDIGYPFEISQGILYSYKTEFNKIINKTDGNSLEIDYRICLMGLNNLHSSNDIIYAGNDSDAYDSLDLIQACLTSWNLDLDAHTLYNKMFLDGRLCHGIISSIVALKIIDSLYHRNNHWPRQDFIDYIIPACTAIFIHNLKEDRLGGCRIDYQTAPIAFLLKLSDMLQEWDRPKKDLEKGLEAQNFDIDIQNNKILFSVFESTEYYKKAKDDIKEAIETTLANCTIEENGNQFIITLN